MLLPIFLLLGQSDIDLYNWQAEQASRQETGQRQYEQLVKPREQWQSWRGCIAEMDRATHLYYKARGAFVIPERERQIFWRAVKKFERCDEHQKK